MTIKPVQLLVSTLAVFLLAGISDSHVLASEDLAPKRGGLQSPIGKPEFLPVDEAFKLTASRENNTIELRWQVSPGYYLYRHRLSFDATEAELGKPEISPGLDKHDEYFGDVEVYYDELVVRLPIISAEDGAVELVVGYQGCADAGLCYPPQEKPIFAEKM
ncbi:MAG: protein-disulfide reductase DsbD domain-containing protein [Pseudomonadales bacterium]